MYLHIFDLNQTYLRQTFETHVRENESHVLLTTYRRHIYQLVASPDHIHLGIHH